VHSCGGGGNKTLTSKLTQVNLTADNFNWQALMALGHAEEDYLKLIYSLARRNDKVSLAMVARNLKVSAPAVTKMIRKMRDKELVHFDRSRGVSLTGQGRSAALDVLRNHRLIELFLHEHLGYTWDEVHEEAEQLEHVISKRFERRIAELLGYPTRDPHGDPIPAEDGSLRYQPEVAMADVEPGFSGSIHRVAGNDAGVLKQLGKLGLYPGTKVRLLHVDEGGTTITADIEGRQERIASGLAEKIFFEVKETTE
jgi:DtxR family transcriptional regulator, Mn-dependent transcriptional regulator